MSETRDEGSTSWTPSNEPTTPKAAPASEAMHASEQVAAAVIVRGRKGKRARRVLTSLIIVALLVGGFFAVKQFRGTSDIANIQGKVALSAQELRNVVNAKKITAYWAGPQDGAKYTLIATTPGVAFVRYLPGGVGLNDTKTLFRAIGTYTQKNAFAVSTAGANATGNAGFVSADGNAVFYSTARPTNIYIGIKGKDIQVEVFDPVVDQALGLVLVKNQVRQIS